MGARKKLVGILAALSWALVFASLVGAAPLDTEARVIGRLDVTVVKDATAAAKTPALGDGYASALINFGFIANGVVTTEQAVALLQGSESAVANK